MKIKNHLVSFTEWKEWGDYQEYIFEDEKVSNDYDAYKDTPTKEECDRLCERLSGEVIEFSPGELRDKTEEIMKE